jgi:phenylalanyl-tRNA synthetase beta chain
VRFSLEWIRRYVDVVEPASVLARRLTLAGLPVDQVEEPAELPPTVVVAKVLEVRPHPNADRLRLCMVDAGLAEPLPVVCGAPNARAGIHSPLALVGTTLPNGTTVKEARIRGELSRGMLCSQDELGLGDDHSGIIEIAPEKPGTPFSRILGPRDTFFEVDVPSNRGDCLSHMGLAREIAALTGHPLRRPEFVLREGGVPAAEAFAVSVESLEDCPRFTAHLIRRVKVGPSPAWLVDALKAVGQRSINNVVDVTNFVLQETGQPLHAFDLDRLGTGRIHVRRARAGERLTTLDGITRDLTPDVLLITDGERAIAAAGVMGGADTEVSEGTVNVLLEVACFRPERILWGSRKLRLDTDASLRFRRGVDPVGLAWAARRAAALLAEVAGGAVAPGMAEVADPAVQKARAVALRPARVSVVLGEEIPETEVAERLRSFGFEVRPESGGRWSVGVPSWRRDVTEECDLVEEVARHRGYDAIGERQYNGSGVSAPVEPEEEIRRSVRDVLHGSGFQEVITRNLVSRESETRSGLDAETVGRSFFPLLDPPTREEEGLRVSLLPGLLSVVAHNLRHGQPEIRIYELGKSFHRPEGIAGPGNDLFRAGENGEEGAPGLPLELDWIGLAATGGEFSPSLERAPRSFSFLDMKGVLEGLLASRRIDAPKWRPYNGLRLAPEGALEVLDAERSLGFAWEVTPGARAAWDLPRPVFVAQLRFDLLPRDRGTPVRYREASRFPAVRRDLALVVPVAVTHADLVTWIAAESGPHLAAIELFDHYRGKHIPAGHVGLGYSLTFRAADRTLEEKDVDAAVVRIVNALKRRGIDRREA